MLSYRDGDAAAFELLYARHRTALFRYLLHQCGKRELADELFQEIWMSVIRASGNYEVSAKFSTWLFRIAHNRLVDHYRASGRLAEFETSVNEDALPELPAPLAAQPEKLLERAEMARRIVAEVDALPAAQRESFLLAAEGGLSVDEIANATGTVYETAKSRLRYAYARLRAGLGDLA